MLFGMNKVLLDLNGSVFKNGLNSKKIRSTHLIVIELAIPLQAIPDSLHHLLMVLITNINTIDFDDAIALSQSSRLSWRVCVNLANMLARLGPLRMQIEAVALEVGPLLQMAQTWLRLVGRQQGLLRRCARNLTAGNVRRLRCLCCFAVIGQLEFIS